MAKFVKVFIAAILISGLLGYLCFAQSESPSTTDAAIEPSGGGDGGFDFNFSLALGVESFLESGTIVSYQKIGFSPDVSIGPFGVGLDVSFHYRFDSGNFIFKNEGDWIPYSADRDKASAWLELYISKIKYIRYGQKGDDLFLKFGSIDDATLGNGFIMGDYANTLFLPEKRIFGLTADLDGGLFDFPFFGIETHVGNLGAFDVIGGRLFFRPLVFFDIPVLSGLQVGGEVVADTAPYKYSTDTAPADAYALLLGGDVRLPLLDSDVIGLAAFGDVASYKGTKWGEMMGFSGSLVNLILFGGQIRFIQNGFIPVYFDPSYDISRKEKYGISEYGPGSSYAAWLANLGFSLANDAVIFLVTLDGPFSEVDPDPENYLNYPHLRGLFSVAEGLMPGFSFSAIYDKTFLTEFMDLFTPRGALAMLRLNYKVETVLITFFYNLRFTTDDWTKPEVTSGLETAIQLF